MDTIDDTVETFEYAAVDDISSDGAWQARPKRANALCAAAIEAASPMDRAQRPPNGHGRPSPLRWHGYCPPMSSQVAVAGSWRNSPSASHAHAPDPSQGQTRSTARRAPCAQAGVVYQSKASGRGRLIEKPRTSVRFSRAGVLLFSIVMPAQARRPAAWRPGRLSATSFEAVLFRSAKWAGGRHGGRHFLSYLGFKGVLKDQSAAQLRPRLEALTTADSTLPGFLAFFAFAPQGLALHPISDGRSRHKVRMRWGPAAAGPE